MVVVGKLLLQQSSLIIQGYRTIQQTLLGVQEGELFGFSLPAYLAWTQLQFYKLPGFLKENKLNLVINSHSIDTFSDFVYAIPFSRVSYEEAIKTIEDRVNSGCVVGVDVSLGFWGLLDHVIFVYGYDAENIYVIDTHKVSNLVYEKIGEGDRYLMKLSKKEVFNCWKTFSRVWEVYRAV